MEQLVSGAVLGVALQHLRDSIVRAMAEDSTFKFRLELLKTTVELLIQKFNEMENLRPQLEDMFPKSETEKLRNLLEKAKYIVSTCSKIKWWNYYQKRRYGKRIDELHQSLQHLLTLNFQFALCTHVLQILAKVNAMNKKLDRTCSYGAVTGKENSSKSETLSKPWTSSQDESSRSRFRWSYEKKIEKVIKCRIFL